jgi:pimeloyl-ACP methyl ester carboxylesterase
MPLTMTALRRVQRMRAAMARGPLEAGRAATVGTLQVPVAAAALVLVLRCGEGDDRTLLQVLHGYQLGTLRVDLLRSAQPSASGLSLLTARAASALATLSGHAAKLAQSAGVLGIGDAAAVALRLAAAQPQRVFAVVACGGQPGAVAARAARVHVPALLIAGGDDVEGLAMHRRVLSALPAARRLETVPGVGSQLDAPGAAETVAHLAGTWLAHQLAGYRRQ